MLQNPCKTLGFKKNMVYKIPPGGGGKPYPASGLICLTARNASSPFICVFIFNTSVAYGVKLQQRLHITDMTLGSKVKVT